MASAFKVGDKLQAKFSDGAFYLAEVVAVSDSKKRAKAPLKVSFAGYGAESDTWVSLDDIKSKKKKDAAPKKAAAKKAPAVDLSVLEKGTQLQAKATDGKWYKAEVVAVALKKKKDTPIKVTFSGYTSASDEWVGADCLRSALLKAGAEKAKEPKAKKEPKSKVEPVSDIGIIGSGVMGSNLGLNIADKGFDVSLYDLSKEQVAGVLASNSSYKNLHGFGGADKLKDFIMSLKKPRKAIMLVPAGKITDSVIQDLAKIMTKGDIIMDVGNANFRDQIRRAEALEKRGLRFLGMGVSGGAEGARKGPAFFPGGTLSVWADVKEIICAAAAKAEDGRPCATMNGKGGAGSCVKMYHNAGEYAILQIWAEVYEVMKAYGVSSDDQAKILESWKKKTGGRFPGLLDSYMLDITIEVVMAKDAGGETGGSADGSLLVSKTMDKTDSKGTGLWSVREALDAAVPCPSLAAGLVARQMSMCKPERIENAGFCKLPAPPTAAKWTKEVEDDLYWAATFSIMASYAQMFQCLRKMDELFGFGLVLPETIATFRAGCILQGFMLGPMTKAFEENPKLVNLVSYFAPEVKDFFPRFKRMVANISAQTNATCPAFLASMDYIQTMFITEIPSAQCVSLQRDVFGRHGFERLDKEGRFNAEWKQLQAGDAQTTSATSHVTNAKGV